MKIFYTVDIKKSFMEKKECIHPETTVQFWDCAKAWELLTEKEKNYAYYFSEASWAAAKICAFQRSYESPALHVLIRVIFTDPELKSKALSKGVTEEEWKSFAVYCAAVLQNFGNYLSFGDCKFVPAIPDEKFLLIIQCSEAFKLHEALIMDIWNNISKIMYLNDVPHKIIGFKDHNGCNTYYSANILKDEAEEIKEYQESIGVSPLNTRLVKFDSKKYALRIASSQKDTSLAYLKTHEFKGKQIIIENGEFAPFLKRAVDNLTKCVEFCANDIQVKMMKDYIEHFTHGDNNKHKDSQRMWIRDINPSVEANIGFTETYVDPLGVRAEFEGWVSVVNKEESKKLNNLVHNADGLVAMLPWNKYFEKDKFKKPDFTALDVVTFACSDIPTGINLPNYDDVKESDGYKNVSLSNSYFVPTSKNINFVPEEDIPTCIKLL